MEFKRTTSTKASLGASARRGSAAGGSTPKHKSTPVKGSLSATTSSAAPGSPLIPSAAPPLPPMASGRAAASARSGRMTERRQSTASDLERSSGSNGNKQSFKRTNTATGLKKAEDIKHNNRTNVYVRVRAFSREETDNGGDQSSLAVSMDDQKVEVAVPKKGQFKFAFDDCFWSNDRPCPSGKRYCTQEEVFEEVGRPLVENALAGYNAAVMAYGQTGSGKTYTAYGPVGSLGTPDEGLIPRVCNMIFTRAATSAQKGVRYVVRASMIEVYLEDVFDLLNNRKQLSVRNDHRTSGFSVVGAKTVAVHNYNDIFALLNKAEPLRTFAATNIHDHSSRAHTLFMLEVQTHFDSKEIAPRCAKIMLADLAGSERIRLAGTEEGLKFEQARNINLSLLALGSCIEAVATRGRAEGSTIPEFRNSTLTKLLKDYIGGNSISSMIVTIGPSTHNANLSVQTLRFADRAKQITTHAKVNTVNPDSIQAEGTDFSDHLREEYLRKKEALYAEYQLMSTIEKLLARIADLEEKIRECTDDEMIKHLLVEIEELQKLLADADYQLGIQRQILYGQYLSLEDELRDLNTAMQEMRAEHEEAIEALLGEESGRFEEMRRSFENRMDNVNRLLAAKETECSDANDEIARLKRIIAELEAKLKAKEEECLSLKRALDALQREYDSSSEANTVNTSKLEEQLEALRAVLAQTTTDSTAQQKAAMQQRDHLNATIEGLRSDVARLEDDLQEKEIHFDSITTNHAATVESLVAELDNIKQQSHNEVSQLEEKLQDTCLKLTDSESQLASVQLHFSEEKTDMTDSINDMQRMIAELENKLAQTTSNLNSTQLTLKETENSRDEHHRALRDTEAKLEEVNNQLDNTTENFAEQSDLATKLSSDITNLKAKLHATEETLQSTEEQLQETSNKLDDTETKLEETEAQLEAKTADAESLAKDLEDTKEQLQDTLAKLEETEGKLEETEAQLEAKTADAESLAKDLEDTKEQLQDTAAELEETGNELAERIEELDDMVGFLKHEIAKRDEHIGGVMQYVGEFQAVTMEAFTELHEEAMEEFMEEFRYAMDMLYGKASREAARFDILRRVLGKIDEDVKQANEDIEGESSANQTPSGRPSRLTDISARGNTSSRKRLEVEY